MTITLIRAIIIYIFVIFAVRILGKRQLGELSTHEFVITILISSTATVPLEDNSIPLTNSLVPLMALISLEIAESVLSMKSGHFRSILQGKPIFIIKDGILQQKAMRKMRFNMTDLIDGLREKDVFDISQVENAIVETNGKLSVQKKGKGAVIPDVLILDGKAVTEYFGGKKTEKSAIELITAHTQYKQEELMLLSIDKYGKVYLIKKEKK